MQWFDTQLICARCYTIDVCPKHTLWPAPLKPFLAWAHFHASTLANPFRSVQAQWEYALHRLMTGGLVVSYLLTWTVGQACAGRRRTGVAQYAG